MNRYVHLLSLAILLSTAATTGVATAGLVEFTEHKLTVTIRPELREARIEDQGRLVCGQGSQLFCLRDSAKIERFMVDGRAVKYTLIHDGDSTRLPAELRSAFLELGFDRKVAFVLFESAAPDTSDFQLHFKATFADPVENVQFSREKVGGEVAGTILDKGAYLGAAACFYPRGLDGLAKYSLTANIPAAWTAVSDGNPVSTETKSNRKIQRFENPLPNEGCTFMAAPYVVRSTQVDSITVATYFFAEDTSLCEQYLKATADYVRMYQELIGPYPFRQFTVADNFFPTGYGMPGWTLLGQAVLKLPFIITSSLGHEVLHNWWGNSVYPEYDRGNWSEPITVYGADYRYKLLSSPAAARDYRKDILKEYLSYVTAGNDFPLREFTSRSSPETRTIGYNKGMMVFHLIHERIGSEAFFNAWKLVYRAHKGQVISWEEWLAAFQQTGVQDLTYVIPEWIERAGAPELHLQVDSVSQVANGRKTVSLKLSQSAATPYRLYVPIRAEGPNVVDSTVVELAHADTSFGFNVDQAATAVTVDPEFHIFRRLYPEEVEPIVSAVLGGPRKEMVSYDSDPTVSGAFAAFGSELIEDSATVRTASELETLAKTDVPVLLNPSPLPDYLAGLITVTPDSLVIGGQAFPRAGHTAVLSGHNWNGFARYLVVLSGDHASLPRIGQLVPHYGKYSYLVFAGPKNVAKGQWPVTESPLRAKLP